MCRLVLSLHRFLLALLLSGLVYFSHSNGAVSLTGTSPKHVALVFGNSNYPEPSNLDNPQNDAADLGETLAGMGYDVSLVLDATFEEMRAALQAFSSKARRAEVSLVYFAGHGLEVEKKNYLIPIDAVLETDHDVDFQTISLDMLQRAASGASRLNVIILDACRNNPFRQSMRSVRGASRATLSGGLAAIEPESGTVIGFAAKEGTKASDGFGRNSPYTRSLLRHIAKPGLDVGQMFRIIRDEVLKETGKEQEPFLYGSLPAGTISLHPGTKQTSQVGPQIATLNPLGESNSSLQSLEDAKEAWEAVKDSKVVSDFDVIISAYSGTIYERLAIGRKRQLEAAFSDPVSQPEENDNWYLATYANLDLFGGDLYAKGISARSVAECAQRCGDQTACRAFTFNISARRCFLKTSYSFAQVFEGAIAGFYFRGRGAEDAPSVKASWELFNKRDLSGIDLGSTGDRDFEGCKRSCSQNPICSGFTFTGFLKNERCWLKSGRQHQPYISPNSSRGLISARRIDRIVAPGRVDVVAVAN